MRRSLAFALFLLASGASAQNADLLSGTSLAAGPATGFESAATYIELRERIAISPVLAIEPLFGVSVESAYYAVDPCLFPPCGESRRPETVRLAPGAAFTVRAPEAVLPGPLADAHVGALGQVSVSSYETNELRYGIELGAAVRLTKGLTLGGALQAVRYARRDGVTIYGDNRPLALARTSVVPMVRLAYAPAVSPSESAAPEARSSFSLGTGYATGFRFGALQTELRATVPLGAGGIAFEPALAWTAATGFDQDVICKLGSSCPPFYEPGADALSIGAGLTGHSGRVRLGVLPLADAHLGAAVHLVNPTAADAGEMRFALPGGASVPVARGLALGVEIQASAYSEEQENRQLVSVAPMLRLVVGG